mmetsp:Transcript_28081/g.66773  ORF Transcript_28081/g.66773 Transcript_28081/m.66773 type:complete len:230 (+) Transcript_28081:1262-1951(+)
MLLGVVPHHVVVLMVLGRLLDGPCLHQHTHRLAGSQGADRLECALALGVAGAERGVDEVSDAVLALARGHGSEAGVEFAELGGAACAAVEERRAHARLRQQPQPHLDAVEREPPLELRPRRWKHCLQVLDSMRLEEGVDGLFLREARDWHVPDGGGGQGEDGGAVKVGLGLGVPDHHPPEERVEQLHAFRLLQLERARNPHAPEPIHLVAKTEGLDAEEVKLPVQIVHR